MQEIRFTARLPAAKTPTRGTEHAAGFDLYAAQIDYDWERKKIIIDTGLNISFDPGHVLLLFSRSGLSTKHGINLANDVGVIDADYRGPLKVTLVCDDYYKMVDMIKVGDRIAQAVLVPIPDVRWTLVQELDTTARGEGGFGSTGQ